jgi:hypothetical protein
MNWIKRWALGLVKSAVLSAVSAVMAEVIDDVLKEAANSRLHPNVQKEIRGSLTRLSVKLIDKLDARLTNLKI